jgi:hypothetical protein
MTMGLHKAAALVLLFPARWLAYVSEPPPAAGTQGAALYLSSSDWSERRVG